MAVVREGEGGEEEDDGGGGRGEDLREEREKRKMREWL